VAAHVAWSQPRKEGVAHEVRSPTKESVHRVVARSSVPGEPRCEELDDGLHRVLGDIQGRLIERNGNKSRSRALNKEVVPQDSFVNEQAMTDDDLVLRAKSDRSAFGLLYDRYFPVLTRYCMRRLLDRTVTEDVVSDVFLTLASKLQAFPGRTETDFRCWLFRIASNAVNAHLRQSRRRKELWKSAVRCRQESRSDAGPSRPTWETLDWPIVCQALLELEERDQTILTLRFFAGCSYEEIAEVVDSTPGAVRTALCRTLSRLRDKFDPSSSTDEALGTFSKD
jgi:RNA polymerase sigma factor (sigma-70 family)